MSNMNPRLMCVCFVVWLLPQAGGYLLFGTTTAGPFIHAEHEGTPVSTLRFLALIARWGMFTA